MRISTLSVPNPHPAAAFPDAPLIVAKRNVVNAPDGGVALIVMLLELAIVFI